MAQALVPLKALVNAKTRLADLLSPDQRIALVEAMAEDVLILLAGHPELERVVLICDDPGAETLAVRCGVELWSEAGLDESGLNGLLSAASERMVVTGSSPLLVLHADLPLLAKPDIDHVLAIQARRDGLVVCCDRAGTGTNLLAFGSTMLPQFRFGVDSCAAHVAWAHASGVPVEIVRRLGPGLDIDTAEDLTALLNSAPPPRSGRTAQVLREHLMIRRIEQGQQRLEAVSGVQGSACAQRWAADRIGEGNER